MPEASRQSSGGGDEPGPMPITRDWAGAGGLQLRHRQITEEGGGSGQPIAKRKSDILYKGEAYLGSFFGSPVGSTGKQARPLERSWVGGEREERGGGG